MTTLSAVSPSPSDAPSRAAQSHAQALAEHGEHGARSRRTLDGAATPQASLRGSGTPEPLPSGERLPSFLGNTPKSVAKQASKAKRAARHRLLDIAAQLLPDERVANCQRKAAGSAVSVMQTTEAATYRGLHSCGCTWICPVCAPRISAIRRDELNKLLKIARHRRLIPVMLTLTARHDIRDSLSFLLNATKGAKRRFHQSRDWKAASETIFGHVTATELTFGRHGWHVHFHTIILVDCSSEAEAIASLLGLRTAWERGLKAEGLDCNDHGFDLLGASAAGDYITKWGAAEELTLSSSKAARDLEKGRTVWELLAIAGGRSDPVISQKQAAALWSDYARLFKGRRQLVWSRGLKAKAGITEKTDEEIAAELERELSSAEAAEIGRVSVQVWRQIIRMGLRLNLLEAVEQDGRAGFERLLRLHRLGWLT